MFYPALVVAILASIVASQTMITAVFQLLSQIIKLSYFPQIKVVHTSKIFHGQIYIPWVNWLLMVGTVVVTAAYNNVGSNRAQCGLDELVILRKHLYKFKEER